MSSKSEFKTASGVSEPIISPSIPAVIVDDCEYGEDKKNRPKSPSRFPLKSGPDVGRVSVYDDEPLTLDVRDRIGTLKLASRSEDGHSNDFDLDNFPSVFDTPLDPRGAEPMDDSPLDLSPMVMQPLSTPAEASSHRPPLRAVANTANIRDATSSTSSGVEQSEFSASARLPRHVVRLPFNNNVANSPSTPFSRKSSSARTFESNRVVPALNLDLPSDGDVVDDDGLFNIEREMMEHDNDYLDEQRYENAIKMKDLLHKWEVLQDERLQLMQKHEIQLSSQKIGFQTQQSADKGVIARLKGVIEDQYATIEKLQNDVMSGQSRHMSESSTNADNVSTSEEAPAVASDQPSSIDKLVSSLRLERRSLHEDKIRLMSTLEIERAEKSSMRQRIDSLTHQICSPQHPKTPDPEKRLLAEAQCQARDLRAMERIYKKEIQLLKEKNEDLKKDKRQLKAANLESDSSSKVMEDRFNEIERERNALKTKLLTADVEQEMKAKCISKLSKQHRTEVTRLLNENHSLTTQLRDSVSRISALESQVSISEEESKKLVELHLSDQLVIEDLTKQCEEGPENPHKGRIQSVSEETILLTKLKKTEIEKEKFASVAESFRLRNENLASELKAMTQQYESARVKSDHSRLKIQELESELETTKMSLIDSSLRAEQALIDATSQTKAESNEQILRLKAIIVELQTKLKALSEDYHAFKKESKGLPRWYEKINKLFTTQITQSLVDIQAAHEELKVAYEELNRRYLREMALRKDLHNELITLKGNIRVFCRARPVLADDAKAPVVSFDPVDEGMVKLNHKGISHPFSFDRVFRMSATQEEVFSEVCPLITSVIDGYNLCIFAYGQTGSGKTYTMEGPVESPGINRRALSQLFDVQKDRTYAGWSYETSVSIVEIYNEKSYDLLSPNPHEKIDGHGATSVPTADVEEIIRVLSEGSRNRAVAETKLNAQSSRSHAIVCVNVDGKNEGTGQTISAKLNLCDLAGSENVGASGAVGPRLEEAKNINKSLTALGLVISGLRERKSHIPYRDSKLTTFLQQSLTGDSKVLMVVQVSPEEAHVTSTKESLKFAERASKVELNPHFGAVRSRTPQKSQKWKK